YWYRLAVAEQNNIGVATCRVTSKPFVVMVNGDDVRTIAISKNVAGICEGNAVTFTAQTTNGGSAPMYQWQLNGNAAGTNAPTFMSSALTTGDVVNCIFTSSLPCNSAATSNSIPITVGKKQTVAISQTICEGESYSGYKTGGIYTDTFTGSNGCDSIRILTLAVNQKEATSEDTTICYGISYKGYTASGVYGQTFTGSNGCDSVHTINLTVLPDNNRKIWNDTTLCTGDSLLISPGVWDTYLWQDGSTGNHFAVTKGGLYSVLISNQCGSSTQQIKVTEQVCNVAFPSAFTPNGDGLNDVFMVANGYNLTYYHLVLFNRWGQKVFESSKEGKGWDGLINGREAGNGTYIWVCEYKKMGAENTAKTKGTVTLIR
ncbi:MAG: gliding motility-associated C-terminal domain-containing protein, partial [Bacteroidota bacterium]|nr:gliding motility-associated C-terminal domain-containing protein [Bacteroidota bacterium]